jgi:hypothetical protein
VSITLPQEDSDLCFRKFVMEHGIGLFHLACSDKGMDEGRMIEVLLSGFEHYFDDFDISMKVHRAQGPGLLRGYQYMFYGERFCNLFDEEHSFEVVSVVTTFRSSDEVSATLAVYEDNMNSQMLSGYFDKWTFATQTSHYDVLTEYQTQTDEETAKLFDAVTSNAYEFIDELENFAATKKQEMSEDQLDM